MVESSEDKHINSHITNNIIRVQTHDQIKSLYLSSSYAKTRSFVKDESKKPSIVKSLTLSLNGINTKYITNIDLSTKMCEPVLPYITEIHQLMIESTKCVSKYSAPIGRSLVFNDLDRPVIIDAMIKIQFSFKLLDLTLHQAVCLYDQCNKKFNSIFGGLGKCEALTMSACLLVASKYHEIYAPEMRDFQWITNNVFTKEELITREYEILKFLKFDLCSFSSIEVIERLVFIKKLDFLPERLVDTTIQTEFKNFLKRNEYVSLPISSVITNFMLTDKFKSSYSQHERELSLYCNCLCFYIAQYFYDISLYEYKLQKFSDLHRSAACLFISRRLILTLINKRLMKEAEDINKQKVEIKHQLEPWDDELVKHSTLTQSEIYDLAKDICSLTNSLQATSFKGVSMKYSSTRYLEVCKLSVFN